MLLNLAAQPDCPEQRCNAATGRGWPEGGYGMVWLLRWPLPGAPSSTLACRVTAPQECI